MQAQGSSTRLTIQLEKNFGVKPTTPNMTQISSAVYGESIGSEATQLLSNAINEFGGDVDARNGHRNTSGSLPFELDMENMDLIFYGVLGSFTQETVQVNGVSKIKKTFKRTKGALPSFTVEKGFLDVEKYFRYSGVKVGNVQLTVGADALVTGTADFVGSTEDYGDTSFDDTPVVYEHKMVNDLDGVYSLADGDFEFTNLTLTIANNLTANHVAGKQFAKTVTRGKTGVSGDLTQFFENTEMYERWIDEERFGQTTLFQRGNDSVTLYVPKMVLSGGNPAPKISGQEGINNSFSYIGLIDLTEKSDIVVTIINDFDLQAYVTSAS